MKTGWQRKSIGELCDLATGGTPSRSNPEYFGGDIKWLVSGDIHQKEIFNCEGRITSDGMKHSNARILPLNSVIIALNGQGKTRGSVALLRTEATCNQSLVSINPRNHEELLPEYLYINLKSRYEEIRKITGDDGNDRRGLNMVIIRDIDLPIPPISEQKRLVRILDEALEAIAIAKTNTQQNMANADQILEVSILQILDLNNSSWPQKMLDEICEVFFDSPHRTPKYQAEGIPALRPRDIVYGRLNLAGSMRVSDEEYNIQTKRYIPAPGDIVYSRELSYGWAAILPAEGKVCLSQGMCVFRPTNSINAGFLISLLNGPVGRQQAKLKAVGAAHPHINISDIKAYRFPVPPIGDQEHFIQESDALTKCANTLRGIYTRKLALLEELKQSLLNKAFSGEL